MGSDSTGPLLVHWAAGTRELDKASISFVDVETLRLKEFSGDLNLRKANSNRESVQFRASPNGTRFSYWGTRGTPQGIGWLAIQGRTITGYYNHASAGHVIPGSDGKTLYTGIGLLPMRVSSQAESRRLRGDGVYCIPSVRGSDYITFPFSGTGGSPPIPGGKPTGKPGTTLPVTPGEITVHLVEETRATLTLSQLTFPAPVDFRDQSAFPLDKRVHFIPEARVIITIPATNDKLVLHRLNLGPADLPPMSTGPTEPLIAASPVKPPLLEKEVVTRRLPAPVTDCAIGGDGRYVVLHLPSERRLAIFDVSAARISRYIPADAGNVFFAAGRDKLVVALDNSRILQRWDLHSGTHELSVPLPVNGGVKALALGSDSTGPMLISWYAGPGDRGEAPIGFIDLNTLKLLEINCQRGPNGKNSYPGQVHFRASSDGARFGHWSTSVNPQGIGCVVLQGDSIASHYHHGTASHVIPGSGGKALYTARGMYPVKLKMTNEQNMGNDGFCVPSVHGPFFLCFPHAKTSNATRLQEMPLQTEEATLHFLGETRKLLTVSRLTLSAPEDGWAKHDFTADKRVYFIPEAKVIITIPEADDKLVLRRFDVYQELEKAEIDYLLVTSQPPTQAIKETTFSYQVVVRSRQSGVTYRLESAPPGMTVTPAGLVKWAVPANSNESEVLVNLNVSDSSGQKIFHTFKLSLAVTGG